MSVLISLLNKYRQAEVTARITGDLGDLIAAGGAFVDLRVAFTVAHDGSPVGFGKWLAQQREALRDEA